MPGESRKICQQFARPFCVLSRYGRGGTSVNKKELLDRCARNGEERILLGRTLDKLAEEAL